MSNHLAGENSPYLLQHAENPVHWFPWNSDALETAKTENKPIFLSIGYAACHWCHVMAHESFEDPSTAAIMNEHFVNIKVDREERPDLDDIYMQAVVALTGQGGWPMSVFLTPQGEPFYGGTYYPPVRRYNMPSFKEVLLAIADAWTNSRESVLQNAEQIANHITTTIPLTDDGQSIPMDDLHAVVDQLKSTYDWKNGGWGHPPKFPQAMTIEYLIQLNLLGNQEAGRMAAHALDKMAKGGMYDLVGGGFARYSVDAEWLVPHFEKMLYDNALLARVYLHAYMITKNDEYRRVCEQTLNFIEREMTHPGGGFFSSLDADSEGEEGKYYVWSIDELREALTSPDDFDLVSELYSVSEAGNFEGRNILQRQVPLSEMAEEKGLSEDDLHIRLDGIHAGLYEYREKRIRPGTDDKVITFWNGLMLSAFAEAGRYLKDERYTRIAQRNAAFLLDNLYDGEDLFRSWRGENARHLAYLEDYAALILGLLSLYQTDMDTIWFEHAGHLAGKMVDLFQDDRWGFYDTGTTHEELISRPKNLQDNATPSGNALATLALLQLNAYTGNVEYLEIANKSIASMAQLAQRHPSSFAYWLTGSLLNTVQSKEVAVLIPHTESTNELVDQLWSQYRPHLVAAISPTPVPNSAPPLLEYRALIGELPTAYVCQNFTCKLPTTDVEEFERQINA